MSLTKQDLNNIQQLMEVVFDQKIEEKGLVTKKDLSHLPTKDDFYNKMDEVVDELKITREEQLAQQARLDRIESHPNLSSLA